MKSDFNKNKYTTEFSYDKNSSARIRMILEMIGVGVDVLDVGCGDGQISLLIKQSGNNVEGVEISDKAADLARAKGIKVYTQNLSEDWAQKLSKKYDVVFAGEVIEHIFDTDTFLKNVDFSLKTGGHLVVTTPNVASLGRRILLLLGKNPLLEVTARETDAGHIRYFLYDTLRQLLESRGFEIVSFTSDEVNFTRDGAVKSKLFAKIFPTLGRTLIVKAKKVI